MKHIWLDKEIAQALGLTTSDIVYHFKKGHIKGAHIDNVGWLASKAEGDRFIKSYLKDKKNKEIKKQKTIFNYKEKNNG